ncbi:MAG: late competence development ComFB family protein [bacterium]|nr:late competence development ComFB family protein [Bacillota bacterium]
MNLINTMESAVAAQLHDIQTRFPQVCFCDRCQRDIQALALNALPARYVVTEEGEIYARTAQLRQQYCTDITIALIQAITKVHKHPRHNQCERGS